MRSIVTCVLDILGREWVSLEDLFVAAHAEEAKLREIKLIFPKHTLRWMETQMDTNDGGGSYKEALQSAGWEDAPIDKKRAKAAAVDVKTKQALAAVAGDAYKGEPIWKDVSGEVNKLCVAPYNLYPSTTPKGFVPANNLMPWSLKNMPNQFPPWLRPPEHLTQSAIGHEMGLNPGAKFKKMDQVTKTMCRLWWICSYCKERHHFLACPEIKKRRAEQAKRTATNPKSGAAPHEYGVGH